MCRVKPITFENVFQFFSDCNGSLCRLVLIDISNHSILANFVVGNITGRDSVTTEYLYQVGDNATINISTPAPNKEDSSEFSKTYFTTDF